MLVHMTVLNRSQRLCYAMHPANDLSDSLARLSFKPHAEACRRAITKRKEGCEAEVGGVERIQLTRPHGEGRVG